MPPRRSPQKRRPRSQLRRSQLPTMTLFKTCPRKVIYNVSRSSTLGHHAPCVLNASGLSTSLSQPRSTSFSAITAPFTAPVSVELRSK